MSLHIRAVAPPTQARLRQLLLESLPQLLGSEARALPSAGHMPVDTLIALDAYQRLWVLSFNSHDPARALLDGMTALQQVRDLLPWLRQARLVGAELTECSLLVLTTDMPAGSAELAKRAGIEWRRLRCLEVNGELGLLIEPAETPALQPPRQQPTVTNPASTPAAPAAPNPQPGTLTPLPRRDNRLTPEEEAFFQHL
ncbi:MAG: hypothetical protein HY941_00575 [Gammaproteobacteria bacterium]|nr:hypothetical protein [Gammaproteobacteria bacterium]